MSDILTTDVCVALVGVKKERDELQREIAELRQAAAEFLACICDEGGVTQEFMAVCVAKFGEALRKGDKR